jgi:hypothetical protein
MESGDIIPVMLVDSTRQSRRGKEPVKIEVEVMMNE